MNPYVGQIALFAFNYAPTDFLLCQGQTLSISQYQELFAVIKTTYGGDGVNTFMLPNTSSLPVVRGFNYAICFSGVFPPQNA